MKNLKSFNETKDLKAPFADYFDIEFPGHEKAYNEFRKFMDAFVKQYVPKIMTKEAVSGLLDSYKDEIE